MSSRIPKPLLLALSAIVACAATQLTCATAQATPRLRPLPGEDLAQWCRNSLLVLEQARELAYSDLSAGDSASARDHLMMGLRRAQGSSLHGDPHGPLTARAIERGIPIAQAVLAQVSGASNELATDVHFLLAYYAFIEQVANSVDIPLYIPYYHRCSECGAVDPETFEGAFAQYAHDEVQLVLDQLAQDEGDRVVPVGHPRAFLKALELAAGFASQDLASSLWATRNACSIRELRELSYRLASYNGGSTAFYRSDYQAVNASYHEAVEVMSNVGPGSYEGGSCGYYGRRW